MAEPDDSVGSSAKPKRKAVTLALQGGGAHGAFTWGVLERLLADERLEIEGISGTSAGAMNGTVVAEGLMQGGRQGAIRALEHFWGAVSRIGRFAPFVRTPFDMAGQAWNLDYTPSYMIFDAISRYLSPYQFNPANLNPVLDVLESAVDFDLVRRCDQVQLYVSATSVRTGKIRVFGREEITAKAVMASACLPQVFQAVEIDGEPYWDGGYMGNPALYPLIYNCASPDVVIVQVNPIERSETPTTTPEIVDRLNEVTFNATLMREMRAIAFVSRLLEEHEIDPKRYKRVLMHRVDVPEEMTRYNASSKMNAEWDFLCHLRELGNRQGEAWLQENFDALGQRSTIDIEGEYL
ncbi:patatin-like phospholipase family protein [Ferruginivarius sediminum]|uniref:Patatin-like phospholipase family protein n=1 Tax=Ferruginivarius sediminum TaxID=2661937 RepID=A0A369TF84_9PROT|nr:patatin-like phospholipase family protein [Ferruginivarius sediminum]RDD61566.1 patatin-like phospholipase family protein [Ferruginivarius sediminum]